MSKVQKNAKASMFKRRTLEFAPRKVTPQVRDQAQKTLVLAQENERSVRKNTVHSQTDSINSSKYVELEGSCMFRTRLVMSLLSGKAIYIKGIRENDMKPGLRDYEVNFLRLLDRITNGTKVKISPTGTSVKFTPGIIIGGSDIIHECVPQRSVGYYLESLLILGPFSKVPLDITLTNCVTNSDSDLSVDLFRAVSIPLMKHFGLGHLDTIGNKTEAPEVKIIKRGAPPVGGGEVRLTCPIVKVLLPVNVCDPGMFKRVRGLSYSTRCSPSLAQRAATAAKGMFMDFIADIHVYTDCAKGQASGLGPGFGVSLAAESTTGVILAAQRTAVTSGVLAELKAQDQNQVHEEKEVSKSADTGLIIPEDVGRICGKALLEEIAEGGCVDSAHQPMFCILMALGPENISRVRFGKLTPQTIATLRLLKEFWGITFRLQPDPVTKTVLVSCKGIGFMNMNRKVC